MEQRTSWLLLTLVCVLLNNKNKSLHSSTASVSRPKRVNHPPQPRLLARLTPQVALTPHPSKCTDPWSISHSKLLRSLRFRFRYPEASCNGVAGCGLLKFGIGSCVISACLSWALTELQSPRQKSMLNTVKARLRARLTILQTSAYCRVTLNGGRSKGHGSEKYLVDHRFMHTG
jgi:hypothetical protein